MRNVAALTWREVTAYLHTPMAYAVLTPFMALSGIAFYWLLRSQPVASIEVWMGVLYWMAVLIVPIITMRLLAEEFSRGSIEMLMTAPVSEAEVVVGKYFGAMALYLFLLAPTLVFPFVIAWLGNPDAGRIATGYLGLVLTGSLLVSLGVFFSSLTRSQVIAAVLSLLANLGLMLLIVGVQKVGGTVGNVLKPLALLGHMEGFFAGVIDLRDVGYFVLGSAFFLFLSVKVMELRRS